MSGRRAMVPGVYDSPITRALDEALGALDADLHETESLHPADSPRALARLLHTRLVHALTSFRGKDDERLAHQLELTNRVLALLEGVEDAGAAAEDQLVPPPRRLVAVREPAPSTLGRAVSPARPEIPISTSDLLVNGHHDRSLGSEVKLEIASADRVDLLCSFLKWSGYRLVENELRDHLRRRPASLRVLTTVYMSATERRALDALRNLGADVRVSYDTTRTRLHAKAWLFHRDSGFSTACVGSSNLSSSAMLDGLEWNVRLSQIDNGPILEKFRATFEQYWDDPEFRPYDPAEFDRAVTAQKNESARRFYVFDIEPRPHQREILDDLASERARGHLRNLVVAATGTGKTIVAALDYARLRRELPRDRLLVVAHRREILEQSLDAFRAVLREGAFGELLVQGEEPVRGEHVFASIQSLSEKRIRALEPDTFDVVIVDEFHHAAADSYVRLLDHVRPRVLVGLTATPERADGKSVLAFFDHRIASELRLWKALDQGLLSPFHYFGVGGAPDLRAVPWSGGRYDTEALSNVYTADDLFASRVLQELHKRVRDVGAMRALGFCVDVAHAEFMARRFATAGIHARAVSGETPRRDRDEALSMLRSGALRVLFSVNLFNEGVDMPDVDTVLFLRPTESATVFLQQLGRGLRRSKDKECLTVLDFIGYANRRFRFDLRYRAIVGGTRRGVEKEIERGFPSLPSGCVIQLDRIAQRAVLANVQEALGLGPRALVEDLRDLGDVGLARFLDETGVDLEDVYGSARVRVPWTFTRMRSEAGFLRRAVTVDDLDVQVGRALARMLHIDDVQRIAGLKGLIDREVAPRPDPDDVMQRWLFVLLGWVRAPYAEMGEAWRALWSRGEWRSEISQLLSVLGERSRWLGAPLGGALEDVSLMVHGTYTLDEIVAGIDERSEKGGVKRIQTGVLHVPKKSTDLLFITLEKSEKHYTPTTLYDDYPISPNRFHWESQRTCHEGAPAGRRYLSAAAGGTSSVLLFVRQRRTGDRDETMPYVHLGRAYHRSHTGARPMQIEWDLEHAMPAWLYQETKRAAG
jgi:superfamily II DNA or RNA helicase/HKD family nuclease